MDVRLTALIALAHVRLRQEMLARYPHLIDERIAMVKRRLPMPVELAGLTSRMARAESQEKEIAAIGRRYDQVQNDIDEAIDAHKDHVDDLEHYRDAWTRKVDSMLARPNGDGPLDSGGKTGQSGQSGKAGGQVGQQPETPNAERVIITAAEVGSLETVIAAEKPEAPAATAGQTALPDVSPIQGATEPERLTVNGVQTTS
jgi:hypothetical protein